MKKFFIAVCSAAKEQRNEYRMKKIFIAVCSAAKTQWNRYRAKKIFIAVCSAAKRRQNGDKMNELYEKLLASWVRLSTSVVNTRVVTNMSYNESLVCHVLYKNSISSCPREITATTLCEETHILKSQMNRILTSLENKKIITRIRSKKDKRQVTIHMNPEQSDIYQTQHEHIIRLIDSIVSKIGPDTAKEATRIFDILSGTADELLHSMT